MIQMKNIRYLLFGGTIVAVAILCIMTVAMLRINPSIESAEFSALETSSVLETGTEEKTSVVEKNECPHCNAMELVFTKSAERIEEPEEVKCIHSYWGTDLVYTGYAIYTECCDACGYESPKQEIYMGEVDRVCFGYKGRR